MTERLYYKLTVTKLKPDGSWYFHKKTDHWYIGGFTFRQAMKHVQEWYDRGADAVEMELLTREQFDRVPNPTPKFD